MEYQEVKWVKNKKRFWYKVNNYMINLKFLCLNLIDDYNYGMVHVDLSNQIRNQYQFEKWTRKRKWRWSIHFWGYQVVLVDVYIIYTCSMEI